MENGDKILSVKFRLLNKNKIKKSQIPVKKIFDLQIGENFAIIRTGKGVMFPARGLEASTITVMP